MDTNEIDAESLLISLDATINETENWITDVLNKVGLSRDALLQDKDQVTCPINSSHIMPKESLEQHLRCCPLVNKGYSRKELNEDKSSDFFYENSKLVMQLKLDDSTIKNILNASGVPVNGELPLTMRRSLSELSTVQRLRIYEYCIATAKAANRNTSIPEDELVLAASSNSSGNKPESFWETLANMRDMKRRRQSYRGKNTSANKKTYVELIRELIENQTEYLTKLFEDERQEIERRKRRERREDESKRRKERNDRKRSASRHRRHSSRSSLSSDSDDRSRSTSRESRRHHHHSHRHHHKKKSRKHKKHKDDRDREKRRKENEDEQKRSDTTTEEEPSLKPKEELQTDDIRQEALCNPVITESVKLEPDP